MAALSGTDTLYAAATAICGAAHVARVANGVSAAPADAHQAAQILSAADQSGVAVSLQGGVTKQDWLAPPHEGLHLLTHRMNAMLDHPWQDMTCTVEAGCTWQAMQDALARHGQAVALDPLWPETATVGGVIATNDSGALRLRYGGLRDLVIGMTIVLADGTVARSGGKVVKNVAGYDLPKLFCGAFGTLGLITEVSFRLHSIAHATQTLTVVAADTEALAALMMRVLNAQCSTEAMQMRTHAEGFALDVRLACVAEALPSQIDAVSGLAAGAELRALPNENNVFQQRETLFRDGGIVFKATMLPTEIAPALASIRDCGGSAVAQATGILTGSLPVEQVQQLLALRARVERAGGSLTLLRMPADIAADRWGALPRSLPLMRRVKQQFDPNRTLNPDRFLGGL